MRDRARIDEQLLESWLREQVLDRLRRRLAERACRRCCELLQVLGQPCLELRRDVDVVVELIDELRGDGAPDLRVLNHLRARLVPGGVVEQLPVDEGGQDRHEADDRRQDDQGPDADAASPCELAGCGRCGRCGGRGSRDGALLRHDPRSFRGRLRPASSHEGDLLGQVSCCQRTYGDRSPRIAQPQPYRVARAGERLLFFFARARLL